MHMCVNSDDNTDDLGGSPYHQLVFDDITFPLTAVPLPPGDNYPLLEEEHPSLLVPPGYQTCPVG